MPAIVARDPHPRGLYTLFFTEMWERFSYYGMRALMILFMVETVEAGGLGFSEAQAGAIYGLYTAAVYLTALPGGWVADRLVGARTAVWIGGAVIALGHFTIAIPNVAAFYLGLALVAIGTGLLKPNISALVAGLYPDGGAARDAGYTIFYMGINLGAFIGPLLCGYLAHTIGWHAGFALAGVGMLGGLVQFGMMQRHLGDIGARPAGAATRRERVVCCGLVAVAATAAGMAALGVWSVDAVALAHMTKWVILGLAVGFFVWVFTSGRLTADEARRMIVIVVLFAAAVLFFTGLEQMGSSFNLFAERLTTRTVAVAGRSREIPASWFQSVNPLLVMLLAPVMAAFWLAVGRRRGGRSLGVKFAAGLSLLAAGYLVMMVAAERATSGPVGPSWLLAAFLLHTLAELSLSPVGLSSVTKLAPPRLVGQMLGIWFLATSLGNLMAGILGGEAAAEPAQMSALFGQVALYAGAGAIVLLLLAVPIQRLAGEAT